MNTILKYPRTPHLEGSGLQAGDEDMTVIRFAEIAGMRLVVEEKVDGANSAISFTSSGDLLLQSRGHYLTGGEGERQFALFKSWAYSYAGQLWEVLGDRFVLYGEWLYAKHTVFYDHLPHYFLAYDLYDRVEDVFVDTPSRSRLLHKAPFITSVHLLYEGVMPSLADLLAFLGRSAYITQDPRANLVAACERFGLSAERAMAESDTSGLMEGLYVKAEAGGTVRGRCKYVRPGFVQAVRDSASHWSGRPLIPNQLRPDTMLF